ncbi:unnamed protein product [Umbelopsis ramanniana]
MYRDIKPAEAPSGWTPDVVCIDRLVWSPKIPAELKSMFMPKPGAPEPPTTFINENVNVVGTYNNSPKVTRKQVKIKRITNPKHPCCGAYGLYAAQTLAPKQLIIHYIGIVEYRDQYDPKSDYVLRFGPDLSIDAGRYGNEARFCNNFRGIGERPNVCFLNYQDERTKAIRVGIFVLSAKDKIKKGDELLVTYGKSFWTKRGIQLKNQSHGEP